MIRCFTEVFTIHFARFFFLRVFKDRLKTTPERYCVSGLCSSVEFLLFYFLPFNSAGVAQTGVFCSLSILIERLKSEGVDVFQTIMVQKKVRSCRTSSNTCPIKFYRKTHKCRIEQFSMTLESNDAIAWSLAKKSRVRL